MADEVRVVATVVSQKGTCDARHQVGDEFDVSGLTPSGLCPYAFYTMFPFLTGLLYGGTFPWEQDPDRSSVACPDAANPVVFELRRMREQFVLLH